MTNEADFLNDFLAESAENLDQIDANLLKLEKDASAAVSVAAVFRALHTLKGGSRLFGFVKLEKLAHAGEDLLDPIRRGGVKPAKAVIEVLLALADRIREQMGRIKKDGREPENSHSDLLSRLAACRSKLDALSADAGAPAATDPARDSSGGPAAFSETSLRVEVGALDRLMNEVGELVLTRNQVLSRAARRLEEGDRGISQKLNSITTGLQNQVMKLRLQPIGSVWSRFPRLVRDLGASSGKEVDFFLEGSETELDRGMIDAVRDPLIHLVRNSMDHGLETAAERRSAGKPPRGRLTLRAFHEGGLVHIEVEDDGRGIDLDRVRRRARDRGLLSADQAAGLGEAEALSLIFKPGFSTADKVTEVSGRGVGMDVVKVNVEKIGGKVDVDNRPGKGVTFRLKLPLTMAIVPALVVACGGEFYALPQAVLEELVRIRKVDIGRLIQKVHDAPVFNRKGRMIPVVDLAKELGVAPQRPGSFHLVIIRSGGHTFALAVDRIQDSQEIVVKPLGRRLKKFPVFAGATIMGDGRVALILDSLGLAQRSGLLQKNGESRRDSSSPAPAAPAEKLSLILFKAEDDGRMALPASHLLRLEEIDAKAIEIVGGEEVVQYRGQILPIVAVNDLLPDRRREKRLQVGGPSGKIPVVVCRHGDRELGIRVGGILDIVETVAPVRRPAARPGVLYSIVIKDRVTEILDVEWLFKRTARKGDR